MKAPLVLLTTLLLSLHCVQAQDARIIARTTAILDGNQQLSLPDVIQDACATAVGSTNKEVAYSAIALTALESGRHSDSYAYPLATLYFRNPQLFLELLARLDPKSKETVAGVVRIGTKDIVGDRTMKEAVLKQLD